jgi:hypothetical protein
MGDLTLPRYSVKTTRYVDYGRESYAKTKGREVFFIIVCGIGDASSLHLRRCPPSHVRAA